MNLTLPVAVPAPQRLLWLDYLAVGLFGIAVGLAVHGQYDKPHGDFHDFRELGRELLAGEFPHSFKRAPVFPLLVAGLGSILDFWPAERPADQRAAEFINALLLPVNALLLLALGRRWMGGAARWAAAWFILLPLGLYSTAHTLVEPLMVTSTLLTLLAAGRAHGSAYAWAAVASMTRYDLAGLIPGLALADLLSRRPLRRTLLHAALACVPLAVWLALTAITWQTRGAEHYVAQVLERPGFDLGWIWRAAWRTTWLPEDVRWPLVLTEVRAPLMTMLEFAAFIALLAGALHGLLRRERVTITLLAVLAGYWLAHAVFPFREERFGYPPSPLLILLAGAGFARLAEFARDPASLLRSAGIGALPAATGQTHASRQPSSSSPGTTTSRASATSRAARMARWLVYTVTGLLALAVITTEAAGLRGILSLRPGWNFALPWACAGGVTLVLLASLVTERSSMRGAFLPGIVLLAVALVQARSVLPVLGSGAEMHNSVLAARYIRDHALPAEGAVSNSPGLLRLYAGRKPVERFLGFDEIRAETWDGVLSECRARGIAYIIWHDELFGEHGGYYTERWRLRRFEPLSSPHTAKGVVVQREFDGRPRLWVYRILP